MRGVARVVGLLGLVVAGACATRLESVEGRFRHPDRGFSLADPTSSDGAWRRVPVEGAALAFRGPEGATMSFSLRCRPQRAEPRILARHLLIGLDERRVRSEGELRVADREGWQQIVAARNGDREVTLKTVTLPAGECIYDWVLVAPEALGAAEAVFDAWVSSFRLSGRDPEVA